MYKVNNKLVSSWCQQCLEALCFNQENRVYNHIWSLINVQGVTRSNKSHLTIVYIPMDHQLLSN